MQYLIIGWFLIWHGYLLCQCAGNNVCHEVKATGFRVQKGVEGEYTRTGRCEDLGNSAMYTQNQPALGWGNYFYLYYFNEPGNYQGWIFSLYPCSDIIFVRSSGRSQAMSPDLVQEPWEEYVTNSYIQNTEININCADGLSVGMIVALTCIAILSVLVVITALLVFIKFSKLRQRRQRRQQQRNNPRQFTTQSHLSRPDLYLPPSPPPYSEFNTEAMYAPPGYHLTESITTPTEHTNNAMNYERLCEDTASLDTQSVGTSAHLGSVCSTGMRSMSADTMPDSSYETISTSVHHILEQDSRVQQQELPPPSYHEVVSQQIRY